MKVKPNGISVYVCIYMYIYVCVYIYMYVCMCVCMCVYMCVYEFVCMCIGEVFSLTSNLDLILAFDHINDGAPVISKRTLLHLSYGTDQDSVLLYRSVIRKCDTVLGCGL